MPRQDVMEKYSYLNGATIHGWTVLSLKKMIMGKEKTARPYAICECQCGTIKPVLVKNLVNNRSKDCGCGRNKTISEIFSKDLIGRKFGKLLVVEQLDGRSKTGHKLYRCRCDCGNEITLKTNQLSTHHTNSCGCLVSYCNMRINQFLTKSNIDFKSEYVVYVDNSYYRFDFYLPGYNLFIEYDGEQHYKPVRFYSQSDNEVLATFARTREHDMAKNLYCEENNINLLRISYLDKDNIELIINSHLQRLSEKGIAC